MNGTTKKSEQERKQYRWIFIKHSFAIPRYIARIFASQYINTPFWTLGIKILYNLIKNLINYNPQKEIHINWYHVIPYTARLVFFFVILHKTKRNFLLAELTLVIGRLASVLAEQIIRQGTFLAIFQNPFISLTYLEIFNIFLMTFSILMSEYSGSTLKSGQMLQIIPHLVKLYKRLFIIHAPLVTAFVLFYILEGMQRAKMDKYYIEKYGAGNSIIIPFILSTSCMFLFWSTYTPKIINISFNTLMERGYVSVVFFLLKALLSVVPIFLIDVYGIGSAIDDINKFTNGEIKTRMQLIEESDLFIHTGVNANNMFSLYFYWNNLSHFFINMFYVFFTYALDYLVLKYLN
jgi:hypothetical protein